jgi:mRNA interferase MazF
LESAGGGKSVVTPSAGAVVLVPFPFSDLSKSKLRPAVVLAEAGRGDWILCQITSNPYGDPLAIPVVDESFSTGSLQIKSYARPGKLFTASSGLMVAQVSNLKNEPFKQIIEAVVRILRSSLP